MNHTLITTPQGEEMVLLAKADFDVMRDAYDISLHTRTMADIASGNQELLSSEEVANALAAATPLVFWRKKRGVTQKVLAAKVGISQSYLAGLEAGDRKGDPVLFLKLARALKIRMEDIVEE
jgi:DNA-binding XRE family transcriptional regulator